uniref:Uncharacterized protein n=1 Tax=Octopus bimaculoides TaxID=37653 RepID=A0A0L8HGG0_OCTBM
MTRNHFSVVTSEILIYENLQYFSNEPLNLAREVINYKVYNKYKHKGVTVTSTEQLTLVVNNQNKEKQTRRWLYKMKF